MLRNFNPHGGRPARNASHPPATLERSDCGLGNDAGGAPWLQKKACSRPALARRSFPAKGAQSGR